MLCGGRVEVFLEPISALNPVHVAVFQEAGKGLSQGGGGLLVTLIDRDRWQNRESPKLFLGKKWGKGRFPVRGNGGRGHPCQKAGKDDAIATDLTFLHER